jgi:limonene-1,2-epoxide hydrolase
VTGTPEEIVDEFIARILRMDLDAACELVSDDCEYDNVPLGKQYGPAGIKGLLGPMVEGLDEVEFVVHRQVAAGNVVMNERNDRFRRGDQWLDLPVVGVFELDDAGRIRLWRDYFDAASFTEQLAAFDR